MHVKVQLKFPNTNMLADSAEYSQQSCLFFTNVVDISDYFLVCFLLVLHNKPMQTEQQKQAQTNKQKTLNNNEEKTKWSMTMEVIAKLTFTVFIYSYVSTMASVYVSGTF